MDQHKRPPMPPALEAADLPDRTKFDLQDIDSAVFQWHRMIVKGELTQRLLSQSGLDLEPALFTGLITVVRITYGVGRDAPEAPTVGLVAEEMNIDPSRASRICSGLISKGLVKREVAQDDGRKTVLVLTEAGTEAFSQMWNLKWENTLRVFEDWSAEDVETFARLMRRYVDGVSGG